MKPLSYFIPAKDYLARWDEAELTMILYEDNWDGYRGQEDD